MFEENGDIKLYEFWCCGLNFFLPHAQVSSWHENTVGLRGGPAGQLPGAPTYKGHSNTEINRKYGASNSGWTNI
jgi:hypothetical protein